MKKKLFKQITAISMACILVTGVAGTNTSLAASNVKNITSDSFLENRSNKTTNNITENIKPEEKTPVLDRILEECTEIEAGGTSKEIRRGQMVSIKSVSGNYTRNALMSNGDLYCWGYNRDGQAGNGTTNDQPVPLKVLSGVKSVICLGSESSSNYYSYSSMSAITENGDLYCWGDNRNGHIGNGTTENQLTPYKVLSSIKSVAYSGSFVSAIAENGDLYCWGDNTYGQLGNGTTWESRKQLTPYKVEGLNNVKSVTYSGSFVSAITENGDLYCWGNNTYGQIGNGTTKKQLTPYKVEGLSRVKSVLYSDFSGSSSRYVLAITENGDLYCWGDNVQLTPYKLEWLSKVKSIIYTGSFVLATTENKDLYCWRKNSQLTSDNPDKSVLNNVKSLKYSGSYVSAITENGDLYCWGYNENGQVGNGTTDYQFEPCKILEKVKSVTYSSYSSISAITENGDLYCWGYNEYGQIGSGRMEDQLTPCKILSSVKSINYSPYSSSISAITKSGDLYCWGYNTHGQIGNGTKDNQPVPYKVLSSVKSVTCSSISVSAIIENGDLYCWGNNENGQVGNGTTEDQLTPCKVEGLSNVKSVTYFGGWEYFKPKPGLGPGFEGPYYPIGGGVGSIIGTIGQAISAITENGDLYCWGFNGNGQIGNGAIEQSSYMPPYIPSIPGKPTATPTAKPSGKQYVPFKVSFGEKQVTGLKLDRSTLSLTTGNKGMLNTIVEPADATYKNIIWSSSNTSVAVVAGSGTASGSGIVTAVSEGTAQIKAKTEDGSFEASCNVTVTKSSGSGSSGGSSSGGSSSGGGGGSSSGGGGGAAITATAKPSPSATPVATNTPAPATQTPSGNTSAPESTNKPVTSY